MQRRTAALYVVFFVVVAIAAYSLTTIAEEPSVSVEGQSYNQGQTISAGGTQWTLNVAGGSGNVSTVNESARFTTSIANNSSVVFRNGTYRPAPNGSDNGTGGETGGTTSGSNETEGGTTAGNASGASANESGNATGTEFLVVVPNASSGNASAGNASAGNTSNESAGGNATNVSSFALRQQFDTAARLRADPAVADTTLTTDNGTQYVRYRNGSTQQLAAYLPTPRVRNVSVGDSFPYRNNSTHVAAINTSGVTLAWRGNLTRSKELEAGSNVSLGGTTYVAQFPQNDTVVLSQNVSGYLQEEAAVEDFHERVLGLWGIVIISLFAVVILVALAYLPVRG